MPFNDVEKKEIEAIAKIIIGAHDCLNMEEQTWVRLAIKRELERSEMRKAIISKSLAGLIWTFIAWIGHMVWIGSIDIFKAFQR